MMYIKNNMNFLKYVFLVALITLLSFKSYSQIDVDARHYIWVLGRFSIKSPPASYFLEAGGVFKSHKASRSPV